MKIPINKIALELGVGDDEKIAELLINALSAARTYTHRMFLTTHHYKGIVDISETGITIKDDTVFTAGDVIEVIGSKFSDGLYIIDKVDDKVLQIFGKEYLNDENFGGYVVKLNFPFSPSILKTMVNYQVTTASKIGVKSESLEGYSYTLNSDSSEVIAGYPISVLSLLDDFVQMPGQESREYRRAGLFIKQPLYG